MPRQLRRMPHLLWSRCPVLVAAAIPFLKLTLAPSRIPDWKLVRTSVQLRLAPAASLLPAIARLLQRYALRFLLPSVAQVRSAVSAMNLLAILPQRARVRSLDPQQFLLLNSQLLKDAPTPVIARRSMMLI